MDNINFVIAGNRLKQSVSISIAVLALYHSPVKAFNWRIQPQISLEQIYSDNIRLSNQNIQSALVTKVSPGVSVHGSSGISVFDLNYSVEGIYNGFGDSGLDIHNQLQMNTDYEFVKDRLYLQSSSSISQQNSSNRQIAVDNVSGANNSSTIQTFKLSPTWTPHFRNYVEAELTASYDQVSSKGGTDNLSESNTFSQNVNLRSGRYFSLFSWTLEFSNSVRSNSGGEDVSFQNSQFEISYAFNRKFNVFAQVGQSNNSFSSQVDSDRNGISYSFGGNWVPSGRLNVKAGYGNNRFITVSITPINRLNWVTTYSNNDIGLNKGSRWDSYLNYTTRRSVWNISYSEDTVTTQQLLLDQQIYNTVDAFGNRIQNPLAAAAFRNAALPTLTDEVFVTKTAQLSVSMKTGKSNLNASLSKTYREFELSGNEEEVTSLSAGWNWRFMPRSHSNIQVNWQETESKGNSVFSDERFDVSLGLNRNIFSRVNGSLIYRFIDQSSNDNLNSYTENRITANLSIHF